MVNLTIGGGSLRGLAFLGALEYLHSNNLLSNIDEFYGCSIGAIIGILYIIGYTPTELLDLMIDSNFVEYWDFDFKNLETNFSLLGLNFSNFIKLIFSKKEDINITFKQFYEKYSININIICVCMSKRELIKFNHVDYPNVELLTGLRASSSIPIIFPPVKIGDDYYIDGCSKCLSGCLSDNTKGYIIRLESTVSKIENFYDYVSELFKTLLINQKEINTINTISISLSSYFMTKIKFDDISNSDKIQLFYEGLKQAKDTME